MGQSIDRAPRAVDLNRPFDHLPPPFDGVRRLAREADPPGEPVDEVGGRQVGVEVGVGRVVPNRHEIGMPQIRLAGQRDLVARRQAGQPHPYVIGTDEVGKFLTMAGNCAQAARVAESGAGC